MRVWRSATVAVRVGMPREHGGVAAQGRVQRVVLRRRFEAVPMIMAVLVVSVVMLGALTLAPVGMALVIGMGRSVDVPMDLPKTVTVPVPAMPPQIAQRRDSEPGAKGNEGNAGGRVDEMSETFRERDPRQPDHHGDQQR
jgi:hypothetical protein